MVSAVAALQASFDRTIAVETTNLFGVPPNSGVADRLLELCNSYFAIQNRILRDYYQDTDRDASVNWLLESITATVDERLSLPVETAKPVELLEIESRIRQVLDSTASSEHARLTARRTLSPRDGIYREGLQGWIYNHLIYNRQLSWLIDNLENAIKDRVCAARRIWRGADETFAIRGHTLDIDGNAALWLYDPTTKQGKLRLSIIFVDGRGEFFGQHCSASALGMPKMEHGIETLEVLAPDGYDGAMLLAGVHGFGLDIPRMSILF